MTLTRPIGGALQAALASIIGAIVGPILVLRIAVLYEQPLGEESLWEGILVFYGLIGGGITFGFVAMEWGATQGRSFGRMAFLLVAVPLGCALGLFLLGKGLFPRLLFENAGVKAHILGDFYGLLMGGIASGCYLSSKPGSARAPIESSLNR